MSAIAGLLNIQQAADLVYVNTIGQALSYDAVNTYISRSNADLMAAMGVFVEATTETVKERYKLPGGGRLERRGRQASPSAAKSIGSWDTAYPLEDYGRMIGGSDVDLAYMTIAELQRQVDTVVTQNTNTVRFEMLKALFNGASRSFDDPVFGTLTLQGLANGDTVTYPPVLGSESEATDDHYIETNYAVASISSTNDPVATARNELTEHFGESTGGDNLVFFCNTDVEAKLTAISTFDEVPDRFVRQGVDTNIPVNLPSVPGVIVGRLSGAWVVRWRWIPTGYAFAMHLEAPAPLKMRVDLAATGLGRGLQLVAQDMNFPMQTSTWRHRFGFGVGNRLNGVALEFGTGGTYTVPTIYA